MKEPRYKLKIDRTGDYLYFYFRDETVYWSVAGFTLIGSPLFEGDLIALKLK